MIGFLVVGLLVVGSAPAPAQPSSPMVQIRTGLDSAEERQSLRIFSTCMAQSRPGWARRTLSYPYLSNAQAVAAAEALSGKDNCIRGPEAVLTFRTSGMVGSLAEHFLTAALDPASEARLAKALNVLAPRNPSEDFALCIAARNPKMARGMALSEPGSSAERLAAEALAVHMPSCSNPGEPLSIELPSLRALISVALYHGTTAGAAAKK